MKQLFFSMGLAALFATGTNAAVITLSGTISSNTTLSAENCYKLSGCVVVSSGVTLTIPAGTQIRALQDASLIIQRGATINATGTATAPIVFTSDQATGSRTPGHWIGVLILGFAKNNIVNTGGGDVAIQRCATTYNGGGTNDADNSGVFSYVRIEYAGGSPTGTTEPQAFILNSVGSGTSIDHIQVTESAHDAYKIMGGTVNLKYIESYNARANDIMVSMGYTGKMQFITALRPDVNAHIGTPSFSYGMVIENNPTNLNNTPLTAPLISNLSILGPNYCNEAASVSTDFKNGIEFRNNGGASIQNSVIAGWRDNGLFLNGTPVVSKTASNALNFAYSAIIPTSVGNAFSFSGPATWSGTGCGTSMNVWLFGPGSPGCSESGNTASLTSFGYSNTLCGNFCSTAPTLSYSGSELDNTNFDAPFDDAFFTGADSKGALQSTDWSSSWSEWCPQSASYCNLEMLKAAASQNDGILFTPNPSASGVRLSFNAEHEGVARLVVSDPISGAILVAKDIKVTVTGQQQVSFDVSRFREGVYPVLIKMSDRTLQGKLVVRR